MFEMTTTTGVVMLVAFIAILAVFAFAIRKELK